MGSRCGTDGKAKHAFQIRDSRFECVSKHNTMPTYKKFEELPVWQSARRLTKRIYDLSSNGAFAKDFGLKDQMRRAAVSIMSNIAEGFEHRTKLLFIDYLGRSKASSGELRSQCYIAHDVGYVTDQEFSQIKSDCESCAHQLQGLIDYLQRDLKHTGNTLRETKPDYETEFASHHN
jgi:four helix bundle protein